MALLPNLRIMAHRQRCGLEEGVSCDECDEK